MQEKSLLYRAGKLVYNVLFCSLLVILSLLIFFLIQSRLSGRPPSVAGYRFFAVLSGSMNPAFEMGSLVVVKPVNPTQLQEDDIITFGRSDGQLVTHRIVGIETEDGLSFITKGDANNVVDHRTVPATRVIGVVALAIPWLGRLLVYSQTKQGLLLMIMIPSLVILVMEGRKLWLYAVQVDKKKAEKRAQKEAS